MLNAARPRNFRDLRPLQQRHRVTVTGEIFEHGINKWILEFAEQISLFCWQSVKIAYK